MMKNPQEIVDDLLARAARLQRMARELADEYNLSMASASKNGNADIRTIARKPARRRYQSNAGTERLTPSAAKLKAFLEPRGSAKREEIIAATDIPLGTIGMLLQKHCTKKGYGVWSWGNDEEKNALENDG